MAVRSSLLVAFATVFLAGCGSQNMAPVKGRVTFDGKPVKEAAITFSLVPASDKDKEPGKPATGFTDENGYYVLSTYSKHDGSLLGTHKVYVEVDDTNPAKCKRKKEIKAEVKAGGNEIDIEMDAK